jgi:hypothetical protein
VELGEPVLGAVVPAAIITSEREVVFLTAPITLNHEYLRIQVAESKKNVNCYDSSCARDEFYFHAYEIRVDKEL